jgi:hypothetical protein
MRLFWRLKALEILHSADSVHSRLHPFLDLHPTLRIHAVETALLNSLRFKNASYLSTLPSPLHGSYENHIELDNIVNVNTDKQTFIY